MLYARDRMHEPVVMVTSLMMLLILLCSRHGVSKTTGEQTISAAVTAAVPTKAVLQLSSPASSISHLPETPTKSLASRVLVETPAINDVTSNKSFVKQIHIVFDNDPQKWDWSKGEPVSDISHPTTKVVESSLHDDYDDFTPIENINMNATYSERAGKGTLRVLISFYNAMFISRIREFLCIDSTLS
jgi:hypothetical protein